MADPLKQGEQTEVQETRSTSSVEEANEKSDLSKVVDLDRVGEEDGYVLDEAILKQRLGLSADAVLKKAKDGKTVLIPQPRWVPDVAMASTPTDRCSSDDPNDPLNWPEWKKSMTLLVIAIVSCCGDYGSATGSIAIIPQAGQWHISPNTVNHVRTPSCAHATLSQLTVYLGDGWQRVHVRSWWLDSRVVQRFLRKILLSQTRLNLA
jgi:hypothetical protein